MDTQHISREGLVDDIAVCAIDPRWLMRVKFACLCLEYRTKRAKPLHLLIKPIVRLNRNENGLIHMFDLSDGEHIVTRIYRRI